MKQTGGAARRASPRELVLASGNPGKLAELAELLAPRFFKLRSVSEFAGVELPEEGDDYAENAAAKARAVAQATGLAALGDDSGIEVAALGDAPGPRSARYGGPALDDPGRAALLIKAVEETGSLDRSARFVCVAALAEPGGALRSARGECRGHILAAPRGTGGFGYDPVFQPEGHGVSMAELPTSVKNRISHRARAIAALGSALGRLCGAP